MADYWDTHRGRVGADGGYSHAPSVRYAFDVEQWAEFPVSAVFETYREAYGLTLEDVSNALKIQLPYLAAIERGAYDALPGRTFAVGYVRSFAHFLQLPSDLIVERFKSEAYDLNAPMHSPFTPLEPPKEKHLSRGLVALISLCLLLACWTMWFAHRNGWFLDVVFATDQADILLGQTGIGPDQVILEPANPIELGIDGGNVAIIAHSEDLLVAVDGPREIVFGTPIPQIRPAAQRQDREPAVDVSQDQPSMPRVLIETSALAWIQVRDAEQKPIVAQMLQAGQSLALSGEPGLTLFTGTIQALSISVNGQAVTLPAPDPNSVVTEMSLDPAYLQSLGALQ